MTDANEPIRTLDQLRAFVHTALCAKENLVENQFELTEMELSRRNRPCGLQFSIHGPRNVRLGAIWDSDRNTIYFYDAAGERYDKLRLRQRLIEQQADAA